jgi:hypothetical protein
MYHGISIDVHVFHVRRKITVIRVRDVSIEVKYRSILLIRDRVLSTSFDSGHTCP